MKYIVEAFGVMLVLIMNLFLCIGVVSVSTDVAAAREYKADVIAEVENSNFNPGVIAACVQQAQNLGYNMEVNGYVYDEEHDIQSAEVRIIYSYKIPLFGISKTQMTRGIAR